MKHTKFWAVRDSRYWLDIYSGRKPTITGSAWDLKVDGHYEMVVCHKIARRFFKQDFPMYQAVQITGRVLKGGK